MPLVCPKLMCPNCETIVHFSLGMVIAGENIICPKCDSIVLKGNESNVPKVQKLTDKTQVCKT